MNVVPFEKRRFREAAQHYLAGRPAYAPALFARVATLTGLDRRHGVLDLGCGPGQIALGFAALAGSVTGIDPEPEMLRIAAAASAEAGFDVRFIEGSSFDLSPEIGRFHLVSIGRAFHWMDRVDTLARLDGMIDVDGAVALFSDRHPDVPGNRWRKAYDALLDRYAAGDDARRLRKSDEFLRHEAILLKSPFPRLERIGVIEERRTPIDRIADRMLSLSSVSRQKIGDRADLMVAELREALQPFAEDGNVPEIVESQALIAFRPR